MLQDALHAVIVLLPGGPQVLLQSPGHGGEDGLGRLPWVHHLPWGFLLLFGLETLDVDEGLLHRNHQPGDRGGNETVTRMGPAARLDDRMLIQGLEGLLPTSVSQPAAS